LFDAFWVLTFSNFVKSACARFSPILKSVYKKLKAEGKEFELVFASLDKTQDSYDKYTADMPWYCLPFQSPVMGKLANLYSGGSQLSIPLLVVLDRDGTVIVPDGVGEVSTDPDGANFPWRPKPLSELLPDQYIDSDKTTLCPMSDLDNKYLMLYFSAHWCPRKFVADDDLLLLLLWSFIDRNH